MQKAQQIFNRMTEVEKIKVRGATEDRLRHLAGYSYLTDLPTYSFEERVGVLNEVHALCMLEFSVKSAETSFIGTTWKF